MSGEPGSARGVGRHPLVALLIVLALAAAGIGGVVAFGAGGKADFALALSPSSQTVTKPANGTVSVVYSVSVTRVNGMTEPITLSVSGAPAGVTCALSPNPVPASGNSATLTGTVSASSTPGTYSLTVTGVGKTASLTHNVKATLVVRAPPTSDFSLGASPATQTITQGELATVAITVGRLNGYRGAVALTQAGAPTPSDISFNPAAVTSPGSSSTLTIATSSTIATGNYTITISGADGSLTHTASVVLVVQPGTPHHFQISGSARDTITPGGPSAPIDLTISNPNPQTLTVSSISVSVEQATSNRRCGASGNFQVIQMAPAAYAKLVLPPNSTKSLADMGVPDSERPQLRMLDTSTNQDACKNATVYLDYTGTGTNR